MRMLIQWIIWASVLFSYIAARPDKRPRDRTDTVEASMMHRKMGHMEMKLQAAEDIAEHPNHTHTRLKRRFELHDWLSESQKREIRKMESDNIPKSQIRDKILEFFTQLPAAEREEWNEKYKKQCMQWIETVANAEEVAELNQLLARKEDIQKYSEKLNVYKNRLPADKREQVDLWQAGCNKLRGMDAHHRMLRRDLSQYSGYAHILTNEQIASLEDMKADGASDEDIERKVEEYYLALPEYRRRELELQYRANCTGWIEKVASDDDIHQLRVSFKKRNQLVFNTLIDEFFERLSKEQQEKLRHLKERCREMWKETMRPTRPKRSVDQEYHEWIAWMTDDQKHELQLMLQNGSSFEEVHKKVNGHFVKLPETMRKQLLNDYKEKCKNYFLEMANPDESERLSAAYAELDHVEYKKIIDEILHRQSEDMRTKAYKFYRICDDVYHKQVRHKKRDIDALMDKHLNWLTAQQKSEIRQMKANGASIAAIKQKLLGYIRSMSSDDQQHVTEKTRKSCYSWLHEVTSAEERAQLEQLHRTDHSACKNKVREYIKRLSLEKQAVVNRDLAVCESIWYGEHEHNHGAGDHHGQHGTRRVRHGHKQHDSGFSYGSKELEQHESHMEEHRRRIRRHHTLQREDNGRIEDRWIAEHMSWLTEEQRHQLQKLRETYRSSVVNHFLEYIKVRDEDTRLDALRKLAIRCRQAGYFSKEEEDIAVEHMLRFGIMDAHHATILRSTKSDNTGIEDLGAEGEELNKLVCTKIHRLARERSGRTKRGHPHLVGAAEHHHHHSLEHYFTTHLKWLSDEQKAEIRKMKNEGETKAKMQHKVLEYYESLKDDHKKQEAREQLKAGCRELLKHLLGDEKTKDLKAMKDAGKNEQEIQNRIEELVAHVDDEKQKELFRAYAPICRRVYGVKASARFRRHPHDLEHYFSTHLNWLSEPQKEEIREMKSHGKSKIDMQKKVFAFYEDLSEEQKHKATEQLHEGCNTLLQQILGDEKSAELKQLKDSGATYDELKGKIDAMLEHVTDASKKEKAHEYGPICRKIYAEVYGRHKREHHDHEHKLEHYFQTHLKWLTDAQKDEIRKMKEAGKSKVDIQHKVMEIYEQLSGEAKEHATEQLKGGCRELLKKIIGEQKMAELKSRKDSGATHEELRAEVDKLLSEVTDEAKKEKIKEYGPACRKIYDASVHAHHKREHHDHEHKLEHYFQTHLKWLTDAQKDEIRKMKEAGKSKVDIQHKVMEIYEQLSGEAKEHATEQLKGGCRELLKKIIGEQKMEELKSRKDSGATHEELRAEVDKLLSEVTDEAKKEKIKEYGPACRKIYDASVHAHHKREHHDHEHKLEHYFQTHLKWLTDAQKDEIRKMKEAGKSKVDIQHKVMEIYEQLSGEAKEHATEQLKGGCRELLKKIIGEQKMAELKSRKDSGATHEELRAEVDKLLSEVTDEAKKEKIKEYGPACRKIYDASVHAHHKREHHDHEHKLEHYFQTHLKWLTDAQKDEIRKMKEAGKSKVDIQHKVMEIYEQLSGEAKEHATEQLKGGCRELLKKIIGEQKMAELKSRKDSGATHEELRAEVDKLLSEVTDEAKKEKIKEYGPACRKIYDASVHAHHKREHHDHEHKLEHYFQTHLKWLTDAQKDEIRKMKEAGKSKVDIQHKVMEIYEQLSGEAKEHATEQLKGGCRELLKKIIGEQKMEELKSRKDSGATHEELRAEVDKLLSEVTDEAKKEKIKEYGPACRKIYDASVHAHHKREHHDHEHKLEHYFQTHLKWLTDAQKDEIRKMKEAGKSKVDIQHKVMEIYEQLSGEAKEHATEQLKGGCRELLKKIIGEQKMAELKSRKDSGATHEELRAEVDKLLSEVTDEAKKEKIKEYGPACRKIYDASVHAHHKREHHDHEHKLEHYFQTHLKWLTDAQKDEIRKMKEAGKSKVDIQHKVMEIYEQLSGEAKEHATEQLKGGCRELLKKIIGEQKMEELKSRKDSGATHEELRAEVDKLLSEVTDEAKKEKIKEYGPACRKIYDASVHAHHKREHHDHEHKLEHYFQTHLKWLTDAQKDEIRKMKEAGKSKVDIQHKVMEIYEQLSGEAKEHATEQLKGGCRELLKKIIGEQKMAELKSRKDSGATHEELRAEVDKLLSEVTDEAKKEKIKEYGPACRKIYDASVHAHHKREHHDHEHKLEHYFQTHLKWLTDAQKDEIRKMKEAGKSKVDIQHKVMEIYEQLSGEAKEHATEQLKGGCRELLKKIIGEQKMEELKSRKDSGATHEELRAEVDKLLSEVTDEAKKEKIKEYGPACRKIYDASVHAHHKREHHDHEHKLEHYFQTHLKWLTDAQKDEIRKMKEAGKSKVDIQHKVMEIYEQLSGEAKEHATEQLKGGCRELLKKIIGEQKMAELKSRKDSGATHEELRAEVDKLLSEVTDEAKKEKIKEYGPACRKIYDASVHAHHKREHHDHEHKLEHYFQTHLKWLTDAQKDEIRKMKEAGKSKVDIQHKVMEIYEQLSGEAKEHATEQLKGGCRELLKKIIGEQKMAELKSRKDSGATHEELRAEVDKLLSEVTDEAKKEKIKEYGPACRKIYDASVHRHKRDQPEHTLRHYINTYLNWLNEKQKSEIQRMKELGKSRIDIQQRVFAYYEGLKGDEKEKARKHLKSGCKEMIRHLVGEERMNELRVMKESGASTKELKKKIDDMLSEITEKSKVEQIKIYRPMCSAVFEEEEYRQKRAEHNEKHSLENYFETHLKWLTSEQKNELKKMKVEGKSRADLNAKIFHYYDKLSGEAKHQATESLHDGCRHILKDIVGEEHFEELKKMKDSGANIDDLRAKVDAMLDAVTDEAEKEKIKIYGSGCRKIFAAAHQEHSLEEYFKTHLKWLTEEQKDELRKLKKDGKPKAEIREKIHHYYESLSGEQREEAGKFLREACRDLIRYVVGDEKAAELKKMKESGASLAEVKHKIQAMLEEITDEDKKAKAKEYGPSCRKIFAEHFHSLEHYFQTHLKWLSDEQRKEIKKMKRDKKPVAEIQEKIFGYLDNLDGDAKCHAVDAMYHGCRELLHLVLGDEKYGEVKKLKENGTPAEVLKKKVEELLKEVKDDHKKEQIKKYGPGCKKVFAMVLEEHKGHSHHDLHSLEHYLKTHLKWLSNEQNDELKKMKDKKKPEAEIQEKILHYYEQLKGDEKDHVTDDLKCACSHLLKDTVGEEKFTELKKLKESGAKLEQLKDKVLAAVGEVKDEAKKKRFEAYQSFCFKVAVNWHYKHHEELKRRSLEDYFKSDLGWLSDEQKEELRLMKKDGKSSSDIQDRVIEFLEKLEGENKEHAVALLQTGCRNVLRKVLGEEKAAELKKMRDSGSSFEELKKKAEEMLEGVTDEMKKEKAKEFGKPCRKVFGLPHNPEHHQHHVNRTLEQYLEHELKWLTEEEKKELKQMKVDKKSRKEIVEKVQHFYEKAEGAAKQEATDILKKSCDALVRHVFGEQAAIELRAMKKSGKTFDEIEHKFLELQEKVTDENKKAELKLYSPGCREVVKYSIEHQKKEEAAAADRRLKRSHHHHFLENYFATQLNWLTSEQQEELRRMKAAGKTRAEIQSKIFEFFASASGETKKLATRTLQKGCEELFKEIGGGEKAHELNVMVHSDVPSEKLEQKIAEIIDAMDDESEQAQARLYAGPCKHLYGIDANRQKRGFLSLHSLQNMHRQQQRNGNRGLNTGSMRGI